MIKQKQSSPALGRQYECETRRQHFNHLRNTSVNMRNCLAWDCSQPSVNALSHQEYIQVNLPKGQKEELEALAKQNRKVSFDANQNVEHIGNKSKVHDTTVSTKKVQQNQNKSFNAKQRSKSTKIESKKTNQGNEDAELRRQIRQKQLEMQAIKQQQRREKVKKYVQDLKPYTRSLTNTKYQDYFDKAAFESYGRVNIKNAIGGIIYGNHQKTFNMNPHIRGNQPKYYQTHYTSINYGKRTKLNQQDKWNRLEKELKKKLGLNDKNQTLKQGKEVVYVDVDDSNMHSLMKENFKFKKAHDQQIQGLEKDYQKQIQAQKKAAVQQFYAKKRERILTGNTLDSQQSTYVCDRDQRGRLQQQVIYRHTDKDGNVRLGADRHALTCFVDMNFPQNDAAYTKELCNRLQIYPIQVESKDKHIDDQRRENYQKSLDNIYPSHYLLPNCDQPQVLKMINNKYGKVQKQKEVGNKSKRMGSTFMTTGVPNVSSLQAHAE